MTREHCIEAASRTMSFAEILIMARSKYADDWEQGCLMFLRPVPWEPKYNRGPFDVKFIEEVVLHSHFFGDSRTWRHRFDLYALCKGYQTFVTHLASDEVAQNPELITSGMTIYAGSDIRIARGATRGLICAFSGVEDRLDKEIAREGNRNLIEVLREGMAASKYSDGVIGGLPSGKEADEIRHMLLGDAEHSEMKVPKEWLAKLHPNVEIIDPDGWRMDHKSFDEPVGREEFERRFLRCTVGPSRSEVPIIRRRWER